MVPYKNLFNCVSLYSSSKGNIEHYALKHLIIIGDRDEKHTVSCEGMEGLESAGVLNMKNCGTLIC